MNSKNIAFLTLAFIFFLYLGFTTSANAMSSEDINPSPPETKSPSWDEYMRLYSISEKEISSINIEYHYLGWEMIDRSFGIESSDSGYRTTDGKEIEKTKIVDFLNSLTDLRKSGGLKYCFSHTDDGPYFKIEIQFDSGRKAILYAASNCNQQRIPWNIVYNNNLYFQGTGEIPKALYKLLASFVEDLDKWWQPSLTATFFTGSGSVFHLNSESLPPEINEAQFSEKDIFRKKLIKSGALKSFLTDYQLGEIDPYCEMFSDCSTTKAFVKLKRQGEGDFSYIVDATFSATLEPQINNVVKASQLATIGHNLLKSKLLSRALDTNPDLAINMHCRKQLDCAQIHWCSASYLSVGKSPPPENVECSVEFILGHRTLFEYLPENNHLWVKFLDYKTDKSQLSLLNIDMTPTLNFFQMYNDDVDGSWVDFGVRQNREKCNDFFLEYDYPRMYEADGSCLFIDLNGELHYVQP